MSMINKAALSEEIVSTIKRYSGRREVDLEQLIGQDIGITGGDGVEILYELEERYGIDLDPLVQKHTTFLKPSWLDKLLGRSHGPPNADLTAQQLIDYIADELNYQIG